MRSMRDRRLMSIEGDNGRSNNNNNSMTSSSRHRNGNGGGNFVTRSWARISGRKKKLRPPTIEEGIEPLEEPQPSTSTAATSAAAANQQIPWKLANNDEKPKPFLNRGMDKLRRSIRKSFRKAPGLSGPSTTASSSNVVVEDSSTAATPWEADGKNVKAGICKFNVKYLGNCEVYESRGVHVCEGALQHLKSRKKATKAILYISGDGLRVVDRESNRGLIVDQTIEKVSFCAPDRHCDKGFAYICREGASRRWLCYGFLTTKESGERVSHAVGCAFTICLEAKKKREAEQAAANGTSQAAAAATSSSSSSTTASNSTSNSKTSSSKYPDLNAVWNAPTPPPSSTSNSAANNFSKHANPAYASFRRQLSITERKQDPQTAIVNDPVPSATSSVSKPGINESTVKPRPVANPSLFDRQGSFKAPAVPQQSFKRFNSLRSDLLSRPNLDSTRLLNTEPIYEGEEFWPEGALSSATIVNTLPVSTSLQFNHIAEGNKENGSASPQKNGIFNPNCQSTPTHQSQTNQHTPSKAEEWLEQTFKSLSFQNESPSTVPHSQSIDIMAAMGIPSGPLSSLPPPSQIPPPLPISRPVVSEQLPPSSSETTSVDAPDSLKTHVRKGSSSRKSIEYQLLEEETAPVSPPRNTPIGVDVFGLPTFVPPVVTRTGPSISDPFDIQWSTAVLKSTANGITPNHSSPSTTNNAAIPNPFQSESAPVNV